MPRAAQVQNASARGSADISRTRFLYRQASCLDAQEAPVSFFRREDASGCTSAESGDQIDFRRATILPNTLRSTPHVSHRERARTRRLRQPRASRRAPGRRGKCGCPVGLHRRSAWRGECLAARAARGTAGPEDPGAEPVLVRSLQRLRRQGAPGMECRRPRGGNLLRPQRHCRIQDRWRT